MLSAAVRETVAANNVYRRSDCTALLIALIIHIIDHVLVEQGPIVQQMHRSLFCTCIFYCRTCIRGDPVGIL